MTPTNTIRLCRDHACPKCAWPQTYADVDLTTLQLGAHALGCTACGWRLTAAEVEPAPSTYSAPVDRAASPRTWLNAEQAAEYVGCSPKTIRLALERGDLRGTQLTTPKGVWHIRRTWVDEWLANLQP